MEFKNVVKRVMDDNELKSQLKNVTSFGEVFNFFRANGYEGTEKELKEKLLKIPTPPRMLLRKLPRRLPDGGLADVAGGISGRQALAACAGILMLTNTFGTIMGTNGRANAMSPTTTSSSVKSHGNMLSNLSRKQLLRLEELSTLIAIQDVYRSRIPDINNKSTAKSIYATEFFVNECAKCLIEFVEILSGEDYADCKSKLDKFLSTADFKNFDAEEFHKKREDLLSNNGFSFEKVSIVTNVLENCYVQYEVLHKSPMTQAEKDKILKSVGETLDGYNKVLSDVLDKQTSKQLKDSGLEITENSFYALYPMPRY